MAVEASARSVSSMYYFFRDQKDPVGPLEEDFRLTKGQAKLRAPALAVTSCETHVMDVNYTAPQDLNGVFLNKAPPLDRVAFLIATTLVIEGGYEKINLITGYSNTRDCLGSFNYTICTLQSAVGE